MLISFSIFIMANANETSPAHTPGPWVLRENGEIKAQAWVGKSDDYICAMPFNSPTEAREMGEHQIANGRLIAAAPDLLEVARSAAVAFEEHIECLRAELKTEGGFADADDINDQIGNYQFLLDRLNRVLRQAM